MKYTGTPRSIIPKAATESTGASMSGRITSKTAANNMSIGIGRNTYMQYSINYTMYYLPRVLCTYVINYKVYINRCYILSKS